MSHTVSGKTVIKVEDKDLAKEALEECWSEDHTVIEGGNYRGRSCDLIVKDQYGRIITGLSPNLEDGETYDAVGYNPAGGHSQDRNIVDGIMDNVYATYAAKLGARAFEANGIEIESMSAAENTTLMIDGKEEEVVQVKVTIAGGKTSVGGSSGTQLTGDSGNLTGGIL